MGKHLVIAWSNEWTDDKGKLRRPNIFHLFVFEFSMNSSLLTVFRLYLFGFGVNARYEGH